MKPCCLILLAGDSRRMGVPKQHVLLAGRSFLEHVWERLTCVRDQLDHIVMVGRAGDEAGMRCAATHAAGWVENPRPEDGPLSSIRCGLDRLPAAAGFLLWPIDHPLPGVSVVGEILEQSARTPDRIVVPSFGGRRGHPTYFPVWACAELRQAPLEVGARWVLQHHPDRITHIETDDRWVRENLNTPELLAEAEVLLRTRAKSEKDSCVPPDRTVKYRT